MREGQSQRRAIIKQESKDPNATRAVKSELKSENDGVKAELSLDIDEYEGRFEVMAMGVVADELPQCLIESFLKFIKTHRVGSTRLFETFSQ